MKDKRLYPIISESTCLKCNSAIAIIRISCEDSFFVRKVVTFLTKRKKPLFPRIATYSKVFLNNTELDNAILILYPKPNSYNGENILEIFTHCNKYIVNSVINSCILKFKKYGIRKAFKGEFTLRAFKNKKIDLSGLIKLSHLLDNRVKFKKLIKLHKLNKKLKNKIKLIYKEIAYIRMFIENNINFEIKESFYKENSLINSLLSLIKKIKNIKLGNFFIFRKKILISIIGHENVGKSSIFNFLTNKNESIVSSVSGTTRNNIKKEVVLGKNVKLTLVDTAGYCKKNCSISRKVRNASRSIIKNSELIINVIDIKKCIRILHSKRIINVVNKIDLVKKKINFKRGVLFTSCKEKFGLSKLKSVIYSKVKKFYLIKFYSKYDNDVVKIRSLVGFLIKIIKKEPINLEIISTLLGRISILFSRIFDLEFRSDILKEIFSNFCIGK
ncbi:GTPase [Candidatus Vidania fulgoroideorum]